MGNKKINRIVVCSLLFMTALLMACNGDIDVKQAYAFSIETMPVQKKIVKGETAEIRCILKREGEFKNAFYTIRYFQTDGKGMLKMDDGTIFLPNDRYPLTKEVFRLYYTSNDTEQQTIDVYVEDNFNQVAKLTFSFNNENVKEEKPGSSEKDKPKKNESRTY